MTVDKPYAEERTSSDSFIDIQSASTTSSDHLSSISSTSNMSHPPGKAKLVYCKSHVAIHPTTFKADNISGCLGLVETCEEGGSLVTWVPNEVLERMDVADREGYKLVGERGEAGKDKEEDGFVFVSVPPPRGEKYAFSIPVSGIYSILVYPPSLSHWYGSATINLTGGVSLPTLYFHDDESPLLSPSPTQRQPSQPRARWGFPPFLSLLSSRALLIRSKLVQSSNSMGAELWLVNPTKSDREVHEAGVEGEDVEAVPTTRRSAAATPTSEAYPPKPNYPSLANIDTTTPKQTLLTSLSTLTNLSRKKASQILSHPLAQPVVPHLPPAFQSLVHVPGEWDKDGRGKGGGEVATEFETARLYLAKWARVVAEEGERNRRVELASQARLEPSRRADDEDLAPSLGAFSLLPKSFAKRPLPTTTRRPEDPITLSVWREYESSNKPEADVRQEIFRRGFSDEPSEKQARKEGWEVLLGVIPWSTGGFIDMPKRQKEREEVRQGHRQVYEGLKSKWKADIEASEVHEVEVEGIDGWKEEWHRIDVDCRRTDRALPLFAISSSPPSPKLSNSESSEQFDFLGHYATEQASSDDNSLVRLNTHICSLRQVLMTYHFYNPQLGYVQGMSDLLAPLYIVFGEEEAGSFWALVGLMKVMESNFLRDQSGMKKKLSTLQQLIEVMDPELYLHLEKTSSLNLFFTYRWILIAFKREFSPSRLPALWDALLSSHYSSQFDLFFALGVLETQREVIIRYLGEWEEVLKYVNDLSGTIDLESSLAQAEVLFLSFENLVHDLDNQPLPGIDAEAINDQNDGTGEKKIISDELRQLLVRWKP